MSCIAYKKLKGENIETLLQKARKRHFRINILASNKVDKGKLSERIGRKAMGLKHLKCHDSQVAGFFYFFKKIN